jgi:hypothetical protein
LSKYLYSGRLHGIDVNELEASSVYYHWAASKVLRDFLSHVNNIDWFYRQKSRDAVLGKIMVVNNVLYEAWEVDNYILLRKVSFDSVRPKLNWYTRFVWRLVGRW